MDGTDKSDLPEELLAVIRNSEVPLAAESFAVQAIRKFMETGGPFQSVVSPGMQVLPFDQFAWSGATAKGDKNTTSAT